MVPPSNLIALVTKKVLSISKKLVAKARFDVSGIFWTLTKWTGPWKLMMGPAHFLQDLKSQCILQNHMHGICIHIWYLQLTI